ncbi:hypothetical protein EMIHUDRAFT_235679 [Emiliania huxleyi CCMP1516]|uniref:Haloacid dehalogenase-like hydrolase domain-containing protein 3 n=2 Tax=Emiliania huxleyi TaxID=2903 RepID=A0A0D3JVE5_EMIH1|nr:hypothetical protein EMIHUDRAFT_235679 [Emiliania huxleyi CCMP1516]EOD27480.1 hypothetical protein EMIHUDRAFT_235679 [Emiliania huxleyi CCMP1516]|eukprot:XP_005779909.1 hypothetical protein EMIHUDRAFT_235679 [Emiliania huxleyi CCMP1516]
MKHAAAAAARDGGALRCLTFEITSTLVCRVQVRLWQDNAELPNFGAASLANEREWWRAMIRSTLDQAGCTEALDDETFPLVFQRIYSSFASPDVWAPCPEGASAMRHAKERGLVVSTEHSGLVVGVCSNVYPRYVDQNLPLLGLHRDLDFAATSYEAGALKPSRDVFDAAARKASHVNRLLHGRTQPDVAPGQAHTVLHVGDDLEKDYLAARAVGMHALLFDPDGKAADPAAERGVPASDVIRSLAEVPSRIDELLGAAV